MNPRVAPAPLPNRDQAVKDLVALGLTEAQARNIVASVQPSGRKGAATLVDWPYVLCTTDGCQSDHGGGIFTDEKGQQYLKLAQADAPEGGCTGEIVMMQVPADENGNITSHGPLVVKAPAAAQPTKAIVDTTAKPAAPAASSSTPRADSSAKTAADDAARAELIAKDDEIARLKAELAAANAPKVDAGAGAP